MKNRYEIYIESTSFLDTKTFLKDTWNNKIIDVSGLVDWEYWDDFEDRFTIAHVLKQLRIKKLERILNEEK